MVSFHSMDVSALSIPNAKMSINVNHDYLWKETESLRSSNNGKDDEGKMNFCHCPNLQG